jgi:hypothetical protein
VDSYEWQDKYRLWFCLNPATEKLAEVFPESEITDDEIITPMFWDGKTYVTVPGTEFARGGSRRGRALQDSG